MSDVGPSVIALRAWWARATSWQEALRSAEAALVAAIHDGGAGEITTACAALAEAVTQYGGFLEIAPCPDVDLAQALAALLRTDQQTSVEALGLASLGDASAHAERVEDLRHEAVGYAAAIDIRTNMLLGS